MQTRSQATLKRQRENDGDQSEQRKCKRISLSPAEPEHTMKIIDLIDDCLINIFMRLDIQSLLNVACANRWLRPAAADVYKRKFGKKTKVNIGGCKQYRRNTRPNNCDEPFALQETKFAGIMVYDMKTCLQYLRCFGSFIDHLKVNYNHWKTKRYALVHQYINDYCAESLTGITFWAMPNVATKEFQKKFTNIKRMFIHGGKFQRQWPTFAKCFSNVRSLYLIDVEMAMCAIKHSFALLEHLNAWYFKSNDLNATNHRVADLLKGAHQLKSLVIRMYGGYYVPVMPMGALLDMIKGNSLITELDLARTGAVPVNSVDVQRIVTEHSTMVKLCLVPYQFKAEDAITLICKLDSVQYIQFQMILSEYMDLVPQLTDSKWKITASFTFDSSQIEVELIRRKVKFS